MRVHLESPPEALQCLPEPLLRPKDEPEIVVRLVDAAFPARRRPPVEFFGFRQTPALSG